MFDKFDFNDSEVHGYYKENENIILNLKYVKDNNLLFFNGTLTFLNVHSVLIDDSPTNLVNMYYPSGDVIHFSKEDKNRSLLIIEWENYKEKKSCVLSYTISNKGVQWDHQPTGLRFGDPLP